MRDYVTNELQVRGEPPILAAFIAAVCEGRPFDFERVDSTPPYAELRHTERLLGSARREWRWTYWGTKWNALNAERETTDEGSTATYVFDNAWNAPGPLVDTLAARYPTLAFKLAFFGVDQVGIASWNNGRQLGCIQEDATVGASKAPCEHQHPGAVRRPAARVRSRVTAGGRQSGGSFPSGMLPPALVA